MHAAIDRVFRSFSLKQPVWRTDEPEREVMRREAEAVASDLLDNFRNHLAGQTGRPH